MPTIEFDDQFVLEPAAPVRERYDMVAILRRNVANLEIALRTQIERAEAAEAELLAVREDNHAMMLEIEGMRTELAKLREQVEGLEYNLQLERRISASLHEELAALRKETAWYEQEFKKNG